MIDLTLLSVLKLPSSLKDVRRLNRIVHGGDLATDVRLYLDGLRNDDEVFLDVYGIPVELTSRVGELQFDQVLHRNTG